MKATIVKHEGNEIEYVVEGGQDVEMGELEEWVKQDYVKLGQAEITAKDGKVSFVMMDKVPAKPGVTPSTQKKTGKFEDEMVTFEDLLTKAHELKEQFSIRTEMLSVDLEKKYALFKAVVTLVDGRSFEGHGDATIENVTGDFIKPHFIRMAETRAIVRALRWYTNNGVAEEEKK